MSKIRQPITTIIFWVSWPALWFLLRRSERTRLLIISGNEFLAVQGWLSLGDWGLPGGGLHRREAIVDGLLREVREETGLLLTDKQVKWAFDGVSNSNGIRVNYHAFYAHIPKKPSINRQAYEIAAYAWVSVDAPQVKLNKDTQAILEWWRKQG